MGKKDRNQASVDAMRKLRQERFEKGLCCRCGKNPLRAGKKDCQMCALKASPNTKTIVVPTSYKEMALMKLCLDLVKEGVLSPERLMEAIKG